MIYHILYRINYRINKTSWSSYIISTTLKNSLQFLALSWKFCIFVYTISQALNQLFWVKIFGWKIGYPSIFYEYNSLIYIMKFGGYKSLSLRKKRFQKSVKSRKSIDLRDFFICEYILKNREFRITLIVRFLFLRSYTTNLTWLHQISFSAMKLSISCICFC